MLKIKKIKKNKNFLMRKEIKKIKGNDLNFYFSAFLILLIFVLHKHQFSYQVTIL